MNIAAVSYLNTAPLIQGLDAWKDCTLVRAVPSQIAGMVTQGQADIGLVSLVDYAHASTTDDPLVMIPAGMIGCDGPTLTVRLFSSVPIDQITTVHADTDSHTSVVLCKLILNKLHRINPEFIDYDAREHFAPSQPDSPANPQTLLMIGDKIVTGSPPAVRYPHQIDLGQAWHDLTRLPFVYATWMCKRSRMHDPDIIAAAHILERTMLKNRTRIDWIVSTHAKRTGWPTDLAQQYIGELLRFQVDDRATQAVETFLSMAAQLNITPPSDPAWMDLSPALITPTAP